MSDELRPRSEFLERREGQAHAVEMFELLGERDQQQDAHGHRVMTGTAGVTELFVVADGHGREGDRVARSAVAHLLAGTDVAPDAVTWVKEQFAVTGETLANTIAGTTASMAVLQGKNLVVGYIGDSEVRLVKHDGHLQTLTIPHQVGVHKGETHRLQAMNAPLYQGARLVVGTQTLEPTRVFGDRDFAKFTSYEPEIIERDLTEEDRFLVLATDGLWKKISRKAKRNKVTDIFAGARDAQEASENLQCLLKKWELNDNITVIIVDLMKY